jgi:hypothetical protein
LEAPDRHQLPRREHPAGLEVLPLDRAELLSVEMRPLLEDGQSAASQQVGRVPVALLPVRRQSLQLRELPEPCPVRFDRLTEGWPSPQECFVGNFDGGFSDRVRALVVADDQGGVDEGVDHDLLVGVEGAALQPSATRFLVAGDAGEPDQGGYHQGAVALLVSSSVS